MGEIVTVSSKGQVVIPEKLREELGIQRGSKLVVKKLNERALVMEKPKSILKMMDEIAELAADRWPDMNAVEIIRKERGKLG